ncbi:DUF4920 domain-containing protein [Polluticoccus soli]|uniref:DUF4920 domain-containing protein n=1 Tax=Polluticoccus soli TaxID=3034150 RepID=UPI0023E2ED85|nr:DUF4920 domain-containing protein [Flavipsychrobacter sp. JY13-12]
MKKLLFIAAVTLFAGANTTFAQNNWAKYGQEFKIENVHTMRSLNKAMTDKTELDNIKLEGRISQVCQAEGCWVKLKNAEGEDVFVKFKDHAFVVPKDLSGRAAIVTGKAIKKEVSVDEQRHLAEDAGASEAEIARINTPKQELRIEAVGVMVKN